MAYITWNTQSGPLAAVVQSGYYELALSATDSGGAPLEFTHIAGTMPLGLQVSANGFIKGVPVIDSTGFSKSITSMFTIRANSPIGTIADRTFSLTVNNYSPIQIVTVDSNLGTFDDGVQVNYQFKAISDNPAPNLTWTIIGGNTPPDLITGVPIQLTPSGLFKGYIGRLPDLSGELTGFDNTREDGMPYDFSATGKDEAYVFTVQVSDGSSFDTAQVIILVVDKANFDASNSITIINDTGIRINADKNYLPLVTSDTSKFPILSVGDKFAFKFDAVDPEARPVDWTASNTIALAGMSISTATGWMTGTVPPQTEAQKTHTFNVYAYKHGNLANISLPLSVSLTTVRDSTNYISWVTPSVLGTSINGSISEYTVAAVNNAGKQLTYAISTGATSNLPQGLKLLSNGNIIGRCSFQYFALDGHECTITVANTGGVQVGMTVEGPGVAAGCQVLEVINSTSVKIAPSTYITEGSQITFANLILGTSTITQLTDLSTTTRLDKGLTTFDQVYKFSVKAETTDLSVSSIKEFTINLNNYNRAPYENIYLKALTSLSQRALFSDIVRNTDIFPDELIYRPLDPNFGKSIDMKVLFAGGLTASTVTDFANACQLNHYNKTINFGNIKTARAVDSQLNTVYEVVYIDVAELVATSALSFTPPNSKPFLDSAGTSFTTGYPNTFRNMVYRLAVGIGYSNRGALPAWMTSRQDNGRVLGLVHGIVLAYTIPGASKLIAYRLQNNGIAFNEIQFVADRYQITEGIASNYNTVTNSFTTSSETTVDINHITRETGTISYSVGQTLVAGTGTTFLTDVSVGQIIYKMTTGSGTVSTVGNALIGVGTTFVTNLPTTSYIYANSAPIGTISTINSNVSITLDNIPTVPFNESQYHYYTAIGVVHSVISNVALTLTVPAGSTSANVAWARPCLTTTFDTVSTRFYEGRDKYAEPESGDKYIKWSRTGLYQ